MPARATGTPQQRLNGFDGEIYQKRKAWELLPRLFALNI
jgi:hypothetical protein